MSIPSFMSRLKDISDQIKRDGVSIPDVLRPLVNHRICQCVVGPSHIAFRLSDGRVCRVSFAIRTERAPQKNEKYVFYLIFTTIQPIFYLSGANQCRLARSHRVHSVIGCRGTSFGHTESLLDLSVELARG